MAAIRAAFFYCRKEKNPVSCHPIRASAGAHEQRASEAGRAHKYFGILSIDRFYFEIKWIAVEGPCRQLSPKRSKPSRFIFVLVQQPVLKKSQNRPRPALPQPGPASWVFGKNRPPQSRPVLFREQMEPVFRQSIVAAGHASEAKSRQPSVGTQVLWNLIDRQLQLWNQIVSNRGGGADSCQKIRLSPLKSNRYAVRSPSRINRISSRKRGPEGPQSRTPAPTAAASSPAESTAAARSLPVASREPSLERTTRLAAFPPVHSASCPAASSVGSAEPASCCTPRPEAFPPAVRSG
jgi:hypothetical protein